MGFISQQLVTRTTTGEIRITFSGCMQINTSGREKYLEHIIFGFQRIYKSSNHFLQHLDMIFYRIPFKSQIEQKFLWKLGSLSRTTMIYDSISVSILEHLWYLQCIKISKYNKFHCPANVKIPLFQQKLPISVLLVCLTKHCFMLW